MCSLIEIVILLKRTPVLPQDTTVYQNLPQSSGSVLETGLLKRIKSVHFGPHANKAYSVIIVVVLLIATQGQTIGILVMTCVVIRMIYLT